MLTSPTPLFAVEVNVTSSATVQIQINSLPVATKTLQQVKDFVRQFSDINIPALVDVIDSTLEKTQAGDLAQSLQFFLSHLMNNPLLLNKTLAQFIDAERFANFATVRALIDRKEIDPSQDIKAWVKMQASLLSTGTKINPEG